MNFLWRERVYHDTMEKVDAFAPHAGRIFVFLTLAVWGVLARRVRRKAPSPVWMIVVSAVLGILIKCI